MLYMCLLCKIRLLIVVITINLRVIVEKNLHKDIKKHDVSINIISKVADLPL